MTGGMGSNRELDSTEVMNFSQFGWREAAKLPSQRYGLRAATVDNKVFIFGIIIKLCVLSFTKLITMLIQEEGREGLEGTPSCSTTPTPGSPRGR